MDELEKQKAQSSQESHKKQAFWQIYFPLLAVLAGIGWAAYKLFSATRTGLADMRVWADISTMLIILPMFMIVLLITLIVILIAALLSKSGDFLSKGFYKLNQISTGIGKVCLSSCKAIQKILIDTESYTSMFTGNVEHFSKQDQEG